MNENPQRPEGTSPPVPNESPDLFDYALLRNYAGFAFGAVRRHRLLAVLCFVAVLGLSAGALVVFPRSYRVQTVIQALRNPSLPALANAGVYRPYEADAPTRAAKETVLRRENLISLVNQTDLLTKWKENRAPAVRAWDAVVQFVSRRERSHDDQVDDLLDRLEKHLAVDVSEGTVTITLDWPNAATAYELVETASQNFLETRHTTEIAMVSDAISILETHAANLQRRIGDAMVQLEAKERAARSASPVARRVPSPGRVLVQSPAARASPEVARLEALLMSKRRASNDLEEFRRRRLEELQSQLTQYQTMYADRHPAILAVRQNIEAISGPSPQLDALRREAQDIEREIVKRGGAVVEAPVIQQGPRLTLRDEPADVAVARAEPADPRLEYERGNVRLLFSSYSSTQERIDQARVEMEASQAAFKYRYNVLSPPQMPKQARTPKPAQVLGAGLVGGLLLAVLACVVADVRSGRVQETWQVDRKLGLPVLARTDR
jgi:uncharacterized protein involved in exopolysaccharide biosynthesis